METMNCILARRSTRSYNGAEISDEIIKKIVTMGLIYPTGKGLYPVEMITVKNPETLEMLSKSKDAGSAMLKTAGAAIVVLGDTELSDTWIEDCANVMTIMSLAATELGVGSCWVQSRLRMTNGEHSDEYIAKALGIPEKYSVLAVLSLGMTDEMPPAHTEADADLSKVHSEKF